MNKTRLVHITTVPMSLIFLRGQVAYMKARGFDISVISSPGKELQNFAAQEDVRTHAVRMHRRITPLRDVFSLIRLTRALRRIQPTIVHAHTPKGGLLGMMAATLSRTPVRIYHMRGLPLAGARGMKRSILWATEWAACRLAHQVICVSQSLRGEAIAQRIAAADKLKVLASGSGNGVDALTRFHPAVRNEQYADTRQRLGIPLDALVIGFVGRLVRDKGVVELIDAWQLLRARFPAAHMLLVGPLEPQDPIPAASVNAIRNDARIHAIGADWNTPALFAAMDMVALPTYREGFPNVLLEAGAMGLPVVATQVAGCTDAVLDGQTGLLVPPRNAEALAAALTRYLENEALRKQHGTAARERVVREFTPERAWQALHAEYQRLLHPNGRRVSYA